ncbi:MAG: serine hydrolase [Candidatus Electrothrix aestuarii]|uniref:Serine hydrolase n=1 Tax=Candidatus Electrothrix aestuarii TaxID=3062594 RepID=A0AAU8LZT3_9BACT|nr:serine hydrolase [Candidatus Electrothrix aestuarii]
MRRSPLLFLLGCLFLISFCSPHSKEREKRRFLKKPPTKHFVFPGKNWRQLPAEALCKNPQALRQFTKAIDGSGVIIKNGYLIKTWGHPAGRRHWASATKPVLSTLMLFAAQEGKIEVHGKIDPFMPGLLGKDKKITFYHLANMTSGYARHEWPGEAFAYNDYAIKLYHDTLLDKVFTTTDDPNQIILKENRLGLLQFQDGDVFEQIEEHGWSVHTSPRDFARIGWLWLNKGRWKDKQLLDRQLFDRYLKNQVPKSLPRSRYPARDYLAIGSYGAQSGNQTPYGPGNYGMNWWFNTGKRIWPSLPEDTFQANGHWNKETVTVIPSMNMVVAGFGDFGPFEPGPGPADDLMGLLVDACGQHH